MHSPVKIRNESVIDPVFCLSKIFISIFCGFISLNYALVRVSLLPLLHPSTLLLVINHQQLNPKTMKSRIALIATFLTVILTISNAQSQNSADRFGFEFNVSTPHATTSIGDTDLGTGVGFEGVFHYRVLEHTGIYLGWGWKHFPSESSFAGEDIDFEETGYIYGIQFKHPFGKSGLSYILRAGGTYNHLELENTSGDITYDTGHGAGWQASAGVEIPLWRDWNLTPTFKYSSLNRNFETDTETFSANLNYLALQVGFFKTF